jgi:hypothetical protein
MHSRADLEALRSEKNGELVRRWELKKRQGTIRSKWMMTVTEDQVLASIVWYGMFQMLGMYTNKGYIKNEKSSAQSS